MNQNCYVTALLRWQDVQLDVTNTRFLYRATLSFEVATMQQTGRKATTNPHTFMYT